MAVRNLERGFYKCLSNVVKKYPIIYDAMFYGRQNMDCMHLLAPDTGRNIGDQDFYEDIPRNPLMPTNKKKITKEAVLSTRLMVTAYYRPDILEQEQPPNNETIEFFLAINDMLDNDEKKNLRFILCDANENKLSEEQKGIKNKILGNDDKARKFKSKLVEDWKNSFKNLDISSDANKKEFKCDRRQLTYIMTRNLNELNEKQKKFRNDFETVIFSKKMVASPNKEQLSLSVTESVYNESESINSGFKEALGADACKGSESINSGFKEALGADACKGFEGKVDVPGLLREIECAFAESFSELSLTDKKEIVDLLAGNYDSNLKAEYGFKGFDISSIITEKNESDIFALLAIMSKQNENTDCYHLIQNEDLKNQALTYRDGLYVKPYVVSAVVVPLAGFGTVGFFVYINFAKNVPNVLHSIANKVRDVASKVNPIVSILIVTVMPFTSLLASYFLGRKAKQNSKTNRDNKDNIDRVTRELAQEQENIK